jgi:hypothetical protein
MAAACARGSGGTGSGGTGHRVSPSMRRGCLLVARIRSRGQAARTWPASAAAASMTCSQLSRISTSSRSASASARRSSGSRPGPAARRAMTGSRTPSASSTADGTSAGSVTRASGTNHAAASSRPGASVASRVLPTPPGPVRVTRRAARRVFSTRAMSSSRPTKLVSGLLMAGRRSRARAAGRPGSGGSAAGALTGAAASAPPRRMPR